MMNLDRILQHYAVACALVILAGPPVAWAEEAPLTEGTRFFEESIRPLLARHCYECHSAKAKKLKGDLRLDNRAEFLRGGESGAAVIPGQPEDSLLIKAVRYEGGLEMPPKTRLSSREVDLLTRWVQMGAPYPAHPGDVTTERRRETFVVGDKERSYWAYQPIARPTVPAVRNTDWAAGSIDHFILRGLEDKNLTPNGPASRRHLIRRAFFDLIGMPPTPQEIERFLADTSPTAWATLVDNLLARPQYGERWGRHWLDVVRFAQSNGYERDGEKPMAWRYRDYVIKSFNEDKPYDQFVVEQLAGDEMAAVTDDSITATGFYRLGVWDDEPDDKRAAEYDGLDDMLSTIGQVFLAQTVGCARCHDHMFDPIPQEDYYRMLAFLRNVKHYGKDQDASILTALPSGQGKALSVREHGREPRKTHVLVRGNAGTPAKEVQPGVFQVLSRVGESRATQGETQSTSEVDLGNAPEGRASTGRRTALARWIASPANPLTARVMVNRIWLHHFGQGIVKTPNDFGKAGFSPTHPELLDWLASEFIAGNWSVKKLHRTIMMSAAYRMSSRTDNPSVGDQDPGNNRVWRQNLRRLDAEAIRDTILAVSGRLNLEMGGRGIFPLLSGELVAGQSKPGWGWDVSPAAQRHRRSVNIFVKRGLRDPMMEAFDYVNTAAPLGVRPTTTVAPQALILLNSRFMNDHSRALANRIRNEAGEDAGQQVDRLFQLTLGRPPTPAEMNTARGYLADQESQFLRLASRITFLPNVPRSLFKDYRAKLPPEEYLLGPREAWSYHTGKWGGGYEGIEVADIRLGPFALLRQETFEDATLRGSLKMHNASELASLLVRATAQGKGWRGYGVELNPREQTITLVRRSDKEETLMTKEARLPVGAWQDFRLTVAGSRLQFWLGDSDAPLLDVHDATPVDAGGLGLATWGAALSLDHAILEVDDQSWDLARFFRPDTVTDEEHARGKALQALCQVVLNLNEFVYVD